MGKIFRSTVAAAAAAAVFPCKKVVNDDMYVCQLPHHCGDTTIQTFQTFQMSFRTAGGTLYPPPPQYHIFRKAQSPIPLSFTRPLFGLGFFGRPTLAYSSLSHEFQTFTLSMKCIAMLLAACAGAQAFVAPR